MYTVNETSIFRRYADAVWNEDERHSFIDYIAKNPEAGDVIPQSGGLRKVRWGKAGVGKRGGARVIYFVTNEAGEVTLLIIYAKAKFDNLPVSLLKRMKENLNG
ncbi:MAG: hypothetical protein RL565_810 [Pseudomonadota bacterium]|jgi:mRNA-degrading endonuclease RelE of RelBE toxin-antitoxin system